MAANYDNSAWFYDRVSKAVFGRAPVRSQVYLLQFIPPQSSILIAGGGTGRILEEIAKVRPYGLKITYAEVSVNMIARSQKRNAGDNTVTFINDAVENIKPQQEYDIVVTPFLLDNFKEENLQTIFACIHHSLKPDGLWLNADFRQTGKWWQNILLRSMLLFFRIICGIEATKLPNIEKCFESFGYKAIEKKLFGSFEIQ